MGTIDANIGFLSYPQSTSLMQMAKFLLLWLEVKEPHSVILYKTKRNIHNSTTDVSLITRMVIMMISLLIILCLDPTQGKMKIILYHFYSQNNFDVCQAQARFLPLL